ncbi:hypothetical protein N0V91_009199 [Didymella pomorum]|uniref:Uncharacterized protein n=1 Tax=Didymella pomorum TaxID=749634 RepID=A0A9W9D4M6_9PLEO|nr:hypothetical protein N0V91_009199 [Didymella pomorum]
MPAPVRMPRLSLASVVCPSAPFLAPRLLRATVPVTATALPSRQRAISSTPRCCTNAAKGKKSGRSYFLEMRRRERQQADRAARRTDRQENEISPVVIELAQELHKALHSRDVDRIADIYEPSRIAGLVGTSATHSICQAVHEAVRRDMARKDSSRMSKLLHFMATLVKDLKEGRIRPHNFAYVHLLSAYKDSKHFVEGRELWNWLKEQDDVHCSQGAYGAAIELMSYGKLMTLPELEGLYEEGLKRYPGTFAEYHFSPDAIVPDRTQPILVNDLPNTLFQGIITARLHSHDWKGAYLGLDTLLRLYPGRPTQRIFELFVSERPLFEAYTAYMLACRSGTHISGSQVTNILNRLRVAMTQSSSMEDRFMLLRAMANALYACQQSGAALRGIHVGEFIKAFEFLLPEKAPGQNFTAEEVDLRNTIAVTAQQIVADLIQSGLTISASLFVPLISLAGKLRAPELLTQTLEDAKTASITFFAVEKRTVLAAAGQIQDGDLVKALWTVIVTDANHEGNQLTYNDWATFAKACRRAQLDKYFEQQLNEQAHSLSNTLEKRVRSVMTTPEPGAASSSLKLLTGEQLNAELQVIQGQMENIRAVLMSGQPLNFEQSPFNMHIDPSQSSLGTEQDLRTIYDEFTTDPHQPAARASNSDANAQFIAPALGPTGIPLDELRFRNWVNVHEMMTFATLYGAARRGTIEKAIIQRKAPKDVAEPFFIPKITPAQNADELRTSIKQLRTLDASFKPGQIFRKSRSKVADDTPTFHNQLDELHERATERKIHKHVAKESTVSKIESSIPDEVFTPKALDPSTSRWVSRKATKISHSGAHEEPQLRKARLEAQFSVSADQRPVPEPVSSEPVAGINIRRVGGYDKYRRVSAGVAAMKIKDIEEENEALRERVRRLDELYRYKVGGEKGGETEASGGEKVERVFDGLGKREREARAETNAQVTSKGDPFPL